MIDLMAFRRVFYQDQLRFAAVFIYLAGRAIISGGPLGANPVSLHHIPGDSVVSAARAKEAEAQRLLRWSQTNQIKNA